MRESTKMILVLMVIAMLSGALLSQVFNLTYGPIQDNLARELHGSIFQVLPNAESVRVIEAHAELFEDDSTTLRAVEDSDDEPLLLYQGIDANGDVAGFAYVSEEAGYGGLIKVMVGVDHETEAILGITIVEHVETPGIGTRAEEESFRNQFIDKTIDDPIVLGNDIDNISGATVTARAVTEAVRTDFEQAVQAYKEAN